MMDDHDAHRDTQNFLNCLATGQSARLGESGEQTAVRGRVLAELQVRGHGRFTASTDPDRPPTPAQATDFMLGLIGISLPREAALTLRGAIFATRISDNLVHPVVGAHRWPTPMAEYDDDSPAADTMRLLPPLVRDCLNDPASRDLVEAEISSLSAAHNFR